MEKLLNRLQEHYPGHKIEFKEMAYIDEQALPIAPSKAVFFDGRALTLLITNEYITDYEEASGEKEIELFNLCTEEINLETNQNN